MRRSTLRWALDPAAWAEDNLDFHPDPWQVRVLRSPAKRKVFNCARQSGKSTVAAIKALHRALFYPGALIILLSPSLRQSSELFRKVTDLLDRLPERPELTEDNKLSLTTATGSRIISLPSNERTIRGYSAVDLVIEDEAAAVPDEIYTAVRPMLAVSNGEYCQLSTPRGKRGHFWEAWSSDEWEKVMITAADNPRISAEFLAAERAALGSRMFAQEYECAFLEEQEGGMFQRQWFANALVDDWPRDARTVRYWDRAATEATDGKDPDYTAGCLMAAKDGRYWIIDMQHARLTPKGNEDLIAATAARDGTITAVRMEEEPGSSGKDTIDHYARRVLTGYDFRGVRATGSKSERAAPFSAACEAGNVLIVRGPWDYQGLIDELCAFPRGPHDDRVDAASGAFSELARRSDTSRFLRYASRRR
jgi:predicted phage terminase large subunit-like protein